MVSILVALAVATLTFSPTVGFAPLTVHGIVRIPRVSTNRAACITLDGPDYFAESCWELFGVGSPTVFDHEWRDLPAGDYRGWVSVERNGRIYESAKAVLLIR